MKGESTASWFIMSVTWLMTNISLCMHSLLTGWQVMCEVTLDELLKNGALSSLFPLLYKSKGTIQRGTGSHNWCLSWEWSPLTPGGPWMGIKSSSCFSRVTRPHVFTKSLSVFGVRTERVLCFKGLFKLSQDFYNINWRQWISMWLFRKIRMCFYWKLRSEGI